MNCPLNGNGLSRQLTVTNDICIMGDRKQSTGQQLKISQSERERERERDYLFPVRGGGGGGDLRGVLNRTSFLRTN